MWQAQQQQPQQQQQQQQQQQLQLQQQLQQQHQQQYLQHSMAPQQTRPRMAQHLQPLQVSSDEEDQACAFQQPQQQQQQRINCVNMMDVNAHSSNPRASRNMAEKQRRDNLNTQIATMASLVPSVCCGGSRKKDKISILRLTAAHLRTAYTLGATNIQFLPRQFNDIDLENCLIENLSGNTSFLLITTTTGKIIYISRHVEKHLGHEQIDLIGDSLYNYIYPDDHEELTRGLTPENGFLTITSADSLEESSNSSDDSTARPDFNFREQRRSFNIRMSQRTASRRESVQYEYLQVSGILRLAYEFKNQEESHRSKKENGTSNDIIFVGTARLLKKKTITELSLLEANKNEYFTRHLVDGRIIFCDHRISIVAGYMSEEVSGTSAFKFMHKDDVRWTIVALRHMYDQGKNYGSSCYRLITKTGEFIYLRTHGYLEYDETTQTVGSFICINTLTSQEEGEELIADMKKRFSATITDTTVRAITGMDEGFDSESECSSTNHGGPSLEDASQLEDAITHLIGDLPSPVINEDRQSPSPLPNAQLVKAAIYSQRLPPASLQASKIGIDNTWPYSGKGGKGKPGAAAKKNINEESATNHGKKNGERTKMVAEKRIPELDTPSSPVSTSRKSLPTVDQVFSSPNPSEPEMYPEPIQVEETLEMPQISTNNTTACTGPANVSSPYDVQTNVITGYAESEIQPKNNSQKINLKRPYEVEDEIDVSNKKKAVDNCVTLELITVDDSVSGVNGELNFPTYIQVQPMTLDTNLQEVHANYQQLDGNAIAVATSENQYIDFQDLQNEHLINSAIETNPEIIKLFTNLPPTIALEGTSEGANVHQYPTSDQGAVVENEVRRAHLQMADSMSSCESQFSDIDESNIQAQCDSFTQSHSESKLQKQKLKGLQVNVQHNIGV